MVAAMKVIEADTLIHAANEIEPMSLDDYEAYATELTNKFK